MSVQVEKLRRVAGANSIAGSLKRSAVPPEKQPDKHRYSGRVALRIRKLRKDKDMSVEDLARAVSDMGFRLATSSLYAWENGGREPALDALPFIAKALGISLQDLIPPK